MSYILEALQRADQERKQGKPPPMPTVVGDSLQFSPSSNNGWKVVWAVIFVLGLLLGWRLFTAPTATPPTTVAVHKAKKAVIPVQPTTPLTVPKAIKTIPKKNIIPAKRTSIKTVNQQSEQQQLIVHASVVWAQLPFQIRTQLPTIHIAALIDHQDPAQKVAWINDRSLHIGQWVTDAVQLIAIGEGNITVAFKGYKIVLTPFDDHSGRWRK